MIACSLHRRTWPARCAATLQRVMDGEGYAALFPRTRLGQANGRVELAGQRPARAATCSTWPGRRGGVQGGRGGRSGSAGRRFDRGIIDDPDQGPGGGANSAAHRARGCGGGTRRRSPRGRHAGAGICITATRWHEDDLVGRHQAQGRSRVSPSRGTCSPCRPWPPIAQHPEDPRDGRRDRCGRGCRSAEELEPMLATTRPAQLRRAGAARPACRGRHRVGLVAASRRPFGSATGRRRTCRLRCSPLRSTRAKGKDSEARRLLGPDHPVGSVSRRQRCGSRRTWPGVPPPKLSRTASSSGRRLESETEGRLDGFGVESDSFQELLADEFVRQTKVSGVHLPIYKITTGGTPKVVRIRRLTPHLTAGSIRFRSTPSTRLLVRQLRGVPGLRSRRRAGQSGDARGGWPSNCGTASNNGGGDDHIRLCGAGSVRGRGADVSWAAC